jgi:butyryl-CoA dehydrogenase
VLRFIGIHFPEEYGGQGYGVTENALIVEEFCRQDSGVGIAISLADFSSELILRFGNLEQKKKYLPDIVKGSKLAAFGLTEADAGSDAGAIRTNATRTAEGYVLNGTKQWITNGGEAEIYSVIAMTDRSKGPDNASNQP